MERKTFKYPLFRMFLVLSESETWWFVSETFKKQIHRSKKKRMCVTGTKKKLIIYSIECFSFISEHEFSLLFFRMY